MLPKPKSRAVLIVDTTCAISRRLDQVNALRFSILPDRGGPARVDAAPCGWAGRSADNGRSPRMVTARAKRILFRVPLLDLLALLLGFRLSLSLGCYDSGSGEVAEEADAIEPLGSALTS